MTDWTLAKCRQIGSEAFTDVKVGPGSALVGKRARQLCSGCPLIAACAEEALACGDVSCIRGGVAIGEVQSPSLRDRLDFSATKGRPAESVAEVDQFMAGRKRRPIAPASPAVYTLKPREQIDYEVLVLTKMAFGIPLISTRLGISEALAGKIRQQWIKKGRLTVEEIRDHAPDRPDKRDTKWQ